MKELELSITTIEDLPSAAEEILRFTKGRKVFALYAEMGAGKTTLVKELCHQLKSKDNFSSPTYSVVNEYEIPNSNSRIYHIDLFRLKGREELKAIGMEDYLNEQDYCFIEWPELAEDILPEQVVKIHLKVRENIRIVSIFMG